MKRLFLIAVLVLCCSTVEARRWFGGGGYTGDTSPPTATEIAKVKDGLPVVNAQRKRIGLPPFRFDAALWEHARNQAIRQARWGTCTHGGCQMGDIVNTGAEGVGTAEPGKPGTWNSCCWTENYRYAAAAYVDKGGQRYCCIHVRR